MATIRGIAYPLRIENGKLAVSEDYANISEQIASVIETRPYERVMRPGYGTPDFIFSAVPNHSVISERMQLSLEQQIDQVDIRVRGRASEGGDYYARVEWWADGVPQPPIEYRLAA